MHHAQVHELERSGAAWTLEWLALPQMVMTTGAALRIALELVASIEAMGGDGWTRRGSVGSSRWLATAVAIAGGVVLVLVTIMTVISVVGRALIPLRAEPDPGRLRDRPGRRALCHLLLAAAGAIPRAATPTSPSLTDHFPTRVTAVIEVVMDALMLVAVDLHRSGASGSGCSTSSATAR